MIFLHFVYIAQLHFLQFEYWRLYYGKSKFTQVGH